MSILRLLFSFKGRASRTEFWTVGLLAGVLFVLAILAVIGMIAGTWITGGDVASMLGTLAGVALVIFVPILIALMWSSYAVAARRLHDRDKSGLWVMLIMAPTIIYVMTALTSGFHAAEALSESGPMVLLSTAIGIWTFIELGCLSGTAGPNQYDAVPMTAAKIKDDFHGSWADAPIEELAGRSSAAAPKARKQAASSAPMAQGFGRRGLQT